MFNHENIDIDVASNMADDIAADVASNMATDVANDVAANAAANMANDVAFFRVPGPLVIGPILELGRYDVVGDLTTTHL